MFPRSKSKWKPKPGGYIFMYVLRYDLFWQSHPFTIADFDDEHLIVYAAVKQGITAVLKNAIEAQSEKECTTPVLLEGQYGSRLRLGSYATVVYIAGGLGITALSQTILSNTEQKQSKLIWVITDKYPLEWFSEQLRKIKDLGTLTQIDIYYTRTHGESVKVPNSSPANSSTKTLYGTCASSQCNKEVSAITALNFHYYKPELRLLVSNEMIKEDAGTIAFVTCGPGSMSDGVRVAVSDQLLNSVARVDYFEENYSW
ncbi:Fre5p [Sugiyamaella lignohabitans]|uniref:Fre5p n=1 Tax=Sugiyamaella lignohabitans TaxID=796027 RepID=A0A161HFM1_9ASCO|nr:Fre5p [Sugiyamaella lignohabitans]ANB11361.1 Fre5p [Sugiyamaella lignohabitans]